jgi:hypothetical protein
MQGTHDARQIDSGNAPTSCQVPSLKTHILGVAAI